MKYKTIITLCITGSLLCLYLLLSGCTAKYVATPVCRHQAVYAAVTFGDIKQVPTRIAVGPTHAQAQAYVDNEWQWLAFDSKGNVITSYLADGKFGGKMGYMQTSTLFNALNGYGARK